MPGIVKEHQGQHVWVVTVMRKEKRDKVREVKEWGGLSPLGNFSFYMSQMGNH